jgi:hypothetical protein
VDWPPPTAPEPLPSPATGGSDGAEWLIVAPAPAAAGAATDHPDPADWPAPSSPGGADAGGPAEAASLPWMATRWRLAAAGLGLLLVTLVAGVILVNQRVSSADTADVEAAEQAFARAECAVVGEHVDRIQNRWRSPWIDAPQLTEPQQGCAELEAALAGSPSTVAVALAELRATTAYPPIEAVAGTRLRELLASPELDADTADTLCAEIERLHAESLVTAQDRPFSALRRCGIVRAEEGELDEAARLFVLALDSGATDAEVASLAEPSIMPVLVDSAVTCSSLEGLAPVLGTAASAKYTSCGDERLAAGDERAAVDLYLGLLSQYPQSTEAQALPARLIGQPGLCLESAPTGQLPFAASPDWSAPHSLACARVALGFDQWENAEGHLQEAVSNGAGNQAATEAAALLESLRPPSGTILGQTIRLSGRIGLAVTNDTADDVVVAVLGEGDENLRFYIRANESAAVSSFPVGDYRLFVMSGSQWHPDRSTFLLLTEASQVSEPFDVPAGYEGETTLTLGVLGGNVVALPPACADLVAAGLPEAPGCSR